jgi:hypothetical protein
VLLLYTLGKVYDAIKSLGFRALSIIFWALVGFVVAFLISASKGNLFQTTFQKLKTRWKEH